jgi:hypothetical protein
MYAWSPPSASIPLPRNTAMYLSVRSSSVAARGRRVAEKHGGSATFAGQEKHNDLEKAIAAATRAAGTPVSTLSRECQPFSLDERAALGASTLQFLEQLSIRISLPCGRTAAPALLDSFRAISYSIWSVQARAVFV